MKLQLFKSLDQLLTLIPLSTRGAEISSEDIRHIFRLCRAFWKHDGDMSKPHVQLSSLLHSNTYFSCGEVLQYLNLSDILAIQMAQKIRDVLKDRNYAGSIDCIVGSATSAITFSHDVARELNVKIAVFAEKSDKKEGPKMKWGRFRIPEGFNVLEVEELITTGDTPKAVEYIINEKNPYPVTFLPLIATIVHRPDKLVNSYGEREVVSLIEMEVPNWKEEKCPLCRENSPLIPVGEVKDRWAELVGEK